jgi:hypothetical protein
MLGVVFWNRIYRKRMGSQSLKKQNPDPYLVNAVPKSGDKVQIESCK